MLESVQPWQLHKGSLSAAACFHAAQIPAYWLGLVMLSCLEGCSMVLHRAEQRPALQGYFAALAACFRHYAGQDQLPAKLAELMVAVLHTHAAAPHASAGPSHVPRSPWCIISSARLAGQTYSLVVSCTCSLLHGELLVRS